MFDAAILDVDGVLTQTARAHEEAWKEVLDRVLVERGGQRPFSHDDYLNCVDGKPRIEGLRDFLRTRAIDLDDARLRVLSEEKSRLFLRRLDEGGVLSFEDAVEQVKRLRAHGVLLAFISSSQNARRLLAAAGIDGLCDVCVDGETALAKGLHGKPDIFREAIRALDVEPPTVIAVEDSIIGVTAAVEVGCGFVIAVRREAGGREALISAGAHRVVSDLGDLELVEPGSRSGETLPTALSEEIFATWAAVHRPALFLDFDGTLAAIVPHPADAEVDPRVRPLVRALADRCTIAIVSGRDREDVARRVAIDGIWYAGSHGFDVRGPHGETFVQAAAGAALPELDRVEREGRKRLDAIDGIILERKRFGLAVHYRMASREAAERAMRVVRELAGDTDHLVVTAGERVLELRPNVAWDKGRAVEHVMGILDTHFPVYVGDGHTDEDVFRVIRHRGIGVIVGPARRPTHADFRVAGVDDVTRLLELLRDLLGLRGASQDWSVTFDHWAPDAEPSREALCTLGNGSFATRGAAEESRADSVHYPGTYLAGGYDRITSEVDGQVLVHEDLVNWPNWLGLTFRPVEGEWLSLDRLDVLAYEAKLDLRRGVYHRRFRVRDGAGRESSLETRRIVSMDDPHVAAEAWELMAVDWSGAMQVRSSLDGTVRNEGVARYSQLRGQHLVPDGAGCTGDTAWLVTRTRQSRVRLAQVARTRTTAATGGVARRTEEHVDRVDEIFDLEAARGRPIRVEKVVVLQSSRDRAISEPLADAKRRMAGLGDFDSLADAHAQSWARLWHRFDIQLGHAQGEANRLLRLHIFHLLQVASPHVVERDVSVPARGLHGEAYRGHIFWDELFILPFLNYCMPDLTRELLTYRYRRLSAARENARRLGFQGAIYPWQSASSGREVSALVHQNPLSGRWAADETYLQRHIDAAVAYNVWQYHAATGDREFLSSHGAEMLLEIARFWASIAEWDDALQRYRIRGVVGPDEFHTRYPGASRPGVDDNAYTNVMAAWCLRTAERALGELDEDRRGELLDQLGLTDAERLRFREVAARLRVVFHDGRIISQFDGYAELAELDWDGYRARYGDIQRLDRILVSELDTPARYKASKQADVLMLFYLFSADELVELLGSMGYTFDPSSIPENVDYYLSRTSHGSTLSRVVHAWVLARSDRPRSFKLFQEALRSDVADIQRGTTAEGLHLGAMAGTVDIVKRGYTGAVVRDDVVWFEPALPDELSELRTRFRVRGAWLDVRITQEALEIELASGTSTARVGVEGEMHELTRGERRRFFLKAQRGARPGVSELKQRLEGELSARGG